MREQAAYLHRGNKGVYDHVLTLTLDYVEEDGQWVGVCLELGTSTFAESLETVRQELREAVELQLNELDRLRVVEEYLRDNHVPYIAIGPVTASNQPGFVLAGNAG